MPTAVRSFCTKGHGLQCLSGFPLEQENVCLIQLPTGQAPSASFTHLTEVWNCDVHVFHGSFVIPGPIMVISHLVSNKGPHLHSGAEHYRACAAQCCWSRGWHMSFLLSSGFEESSKIHRQQSGRINITVRGAFGPMAGSHAVESQV